MGAIQSSSTKSPWETCSYREFLALIREMNYNYKMVTLSDDHYLCFALRKESLVETSDWKSTIEVMCCKVDRLSKRLVSSKKLSFRSFISAYEVHKMLLAQNRADMTSSRVIFADTADVEGNCVICMELPNEVLLPCLHAFCTVCIANEMEFRPDFACPICKTRISNPIESAWAVPDAPLDEEIESYLKGVAD